MDEREEARKRDRERQKKREEARLARENQVKANMIRLAVGGGTLLLVLGIGLFAGGKLREKQKAEAAREKARQEELALKKEQEQYTVDILAVGDNIAHKPIRESGIKENGEWNYDHVYQYVKEDIEKADLAIITQETVFVEDREDVSGYPSFGTPVEFGDALVNAGFDVVAHATNHILDKGTDSIEYTMDWWEEKYPKVEVLGIHDSEESAEEISVVTCKKMKIAMLDFTYDLNGLELPEKKSYMVDVFDEEKVRKDIRAAKELGDVVMVVMHVGEEYNQDIDAQTKEWVDLFLEEGVDVVLGSHPHVVRTAETLTGEDGHKMLVYYSLGNFTSTQEDLPSIMGAMAKFTLRKDVKTGEIQISNQEFLPLLMYYDRENPAAAVYSLKDYPAELVEKHSAYKKNPGEFSLDYYEKLFEKTRKKAENPLPAA